MSFLEKLKTIWNRSPKESQAGEGSAVYIRRWLKLTLLSDVALTSSSATAEAPKSLGFVPGSCLLGAAARQIYERTEDPWSMFYTGDVIFGAGYPLTPSGEPTVPSPLALHYDKLKAAGKQDSGGGEEHGTSYRNALAGLPKEAQWKQLREGFLSVQAQGSEGVLVTPRHASTLRTAIGADGRAEEAFLYGTDALEAGLQLVAWVGALDKAKLEEVVKALVGEIRAGRSRNTEFGRIRVEEADYALAARCEALYKSGASEKNEEPHILYTLTDLALRDPDTGALTLELSAEVLGVADAFTVDWGKSYLRTRSYSPFNGTFKRPGLERQLIEAGSVFSVTPGKRWEQLKARLERPVGLYTAEGLGWLLLDPPFLVHGQLQLLKEEKVKDVKKAHEDRMLALIRQDPAFQWIARRQATHDLEQRAWKVACDWAEDLRKFNEEVNMRAQWGAVRYKAATEPDSAELFKALFAELQKQEKGKKLDGRARGGLVKSGVRKGSERWGRKRGGKTLGQRFEDLVEEEMKSGRLPAPWLSRAVEILASRMVRESRKADSKEEVSR